MPCSQRKESGFCVHWLGSYYSNKVKNGYYVITYNVELFDATQKCDDFLIPSVTPGVESFSTIYNMNISHNFQVLLYLNSMN